MTAVSAVIQLPEAWSRDSACNAKRDYDAEIKLFDSRHDEGNVEMDW